MKHVNNNYLSVVAHILSVLTELLIFAGMFRQTCLELSQKQR